jgi:hypothetical protein
MEIAPDSAPFTNASPTSARLKSDRMKRISEEWLIF